MFNGGGNMAGMMKKVQKMQSEMKKMQDELKRKKIVPASVYEKIKDRVIAHKR